MVNFYYSSAHFNHFFIMRPGKYIDMTINAWCTGKMKHAALILFLILMPASIPASPLFSFPEAPPQSYSDAETSPTEQPARKSFFSINVLPPIDGRDSFACVRDHSILRRPEVRRALFRYLTDGRSYVLRGIEKGDQLKNDIDSAISARSVPKEVAALPLLESGYEPFAVSRMKAVGVWQIIAPTGLALGLDIGRWTDERRDVKKSTAAALQHLSHLYTLYNHWDFALAAYNGGSPRVSQAIARNKTHDYWTLVELGAFRKETNDYVPQFSALAFIMFNREIFGIGTPDAVPAESDRIRLAHPVRIDALARLAGTDVDTVMRLNPEMIGPVTPPDRENYAVKLPSGSADRILGKEDELYKYKISYILKYRVRKGDTVSRIAKLYGADPSAIIYLNGIAKPYYLRIGREIWVPRG